MKLRKGVEDMEIKNAKFELKASGDNYFEGYASVFGNIDSHEDVIEYGAFTKTIKENRNRIKILWQHDMTEPIGLPEVMEEDSKGLYVKGKISMTDTGIKALTLIKDGVINEMSIGFDIIKKDYSKLGNKDVRVLKEIRLWEFSPVTFASNSMAKIQKFNHIINSVGNDKNLIKNAIEKLENLLSEYEPIEITQKSEEEQELESILSIIKNLKEGTTCQQ
jgi:HK97 family phage prohead protease